MWVSWPEATFRNLFFAEDVRLVAEASADEESKEYQVLGIRVRMGLDCPPKFRTIKVTGECCRRLTSYTDVSGLPVLSFETASKMQCGGLTIDPCSWAAIIKADLQHPHTDHSIPIRDRFILGVGSCEFVVAGDRIYQSDGLNFGLGLQGGTLAFPE